MELDIQNKKIEIIQWLTTLEDSVVIQKILELKKSNTEDWWQELSDAEKKSINKGINEAKKGKLKSQSEAKKIYGKWL